MLRTEIIFQTGGSYPDETPSFDYAEPAGNVRAIAGRIDLAAYFDAHGRTWSEEIFASYARYAARLARISRWFWTSPIGRIDLRPWGQVALFKSFFVARALACWFDDHGYPPRVHLLHTPAEVVTYLREFVPQRQFRCTGRPAAPLIPGGIRALLRTLMLTAYDIIHLTRAHLFAPVPRTEGARTIVLFELFSPSFSLERGMRYYFDHLFTGRSHHVHFGCMEYAGADVRRLKANAPDGHFFLLSFLSPWGLVRSLWHYAYLFIVCVFLPVHGLPCIIGGRTSRSFWRRWAGREFLRVPFVRNICACYALDRLLARAARPVIVYPYEEKGLERAYLFAARRHRCRTVGYLPFPQHRLGLILHEKNPGPHPDRYAFTGPAAAAYFVQYLCKDRSTVSVWGGGVCAAPRAAVPQTGRSTDMPLTVFFPLSHPSELTVFVRWLTAEERLRQGVIYRIRSYPSVSARLFAEQIGDMRAQYPFVEQAAGSLEEEVRRADLTIFCATSAGLSAPEQGRPAVYVNCADTFAANPCFDDLTAFLPALTPVQLAERFDTVRTAAAETMRTIVETQQERIREMFTPIDYAAVERDSTEQENR